MVDDVLVKVDRASMLTSLEVRAPFLDKHVIEFAFSKLPDAYRATAKDRKVILRALGSRLLPQSLDLTRKQGFSIPLDAWMRGAWMPLLQEAKHNSASLVRADAIERYEKTLVGGQTVGERLFSLLTLQLWQSTYRVTDVVE